MVVAFSICQVSGWGSGQQQEGSWGLVTGVVAQGERRMGRCDRWSVTRQAKDCFLAHHMGANGHDPLYNAGTTWPVSPAYGKASADKPLPPYRLSISSKVKGRSSVS